MPRGRLSKKNKKERINNIRKNAPTLQSEATAPRERVVFNFKPSSLSRDWLMLSRENLNLNFHCSFNNAQIPDFADVFSGENLDYDEAEIIPVPIPDIGGDGNCLFRSLSYLLTQNQDSHLDLRLACVSYYHMIKDVADVLYTDYYQSIDRPGLHIPLGEISDLGRVNKYAGTLALFSLASMLNTTIVVAQVSPNLIEYVHHPPIFAENSLPTASDSKIYLKFFVVNSHYAPIVSVLRTNPISRPEAPTQTINTASSPTPLQPIRDSNVEITTVTLVYSLHIS